MICKQRASQSTHGAGDHKADQPITERRKANRTHAPFIGSSSLNDHAKARIDDAPDQINAQQKQNKTKIVEYHAVVQIERRSKAAAVVNRQSIIAAVTIEPDGDVIDHLCKR